MHPILLIMWTAFQSFIHNLDNNNRASHISRKKTQNFAEKLADFAGKKSKFAQKSADFAGFSREKSQNSQKKRPISQEISGGNFAKKQSVKNSRFRWIFLANFVKIDQFCVDMTSTV